MAGNEFTAADYVEWWTPVQALAYAKRCVGEEGAADAVWQRIIGGAVRAAAAQTSNTVKNQPPSIHPLPALIPGHYWADHIANGPDFWSGDAVFVVIQGGKVVTVRCFQIRLDPDRLRGSLPPLQKPKADLPAAAPAPTVHAPSTARQGKPDSSPPLLSPPRQVGAPRKDFWDDLLVEVFRQLWLGTLTPRRPADIEKAMLAWADDRGFKLGETSVKKPAKKLFEAWAKKGQE